MTRFLFVVPPFVGHINPTVSVAQELSARGHETRWVGHKQVLERLLPERAARFALADEVPDGIARAVAEKGERARGAARLKFLWEDILVPLARAMHPGVSAAVAEFRPDVLVVDQQALAGALVARARNLPWATFATTSAALADPLAEWPKVKVWHADLLRDLQREVGLAPLDVPDCSPRLVVAFSTEVLVGPLSGFPAHYQFVGPSIHARAEHTPFPWGRLGDGQRVLVSLGTVNAEAGKKFYPRVLEAFADENLQVILVAPAGLVAEAPENFIVSRFVPQLALLPHVHAVVSHAGHNTVAETLAHGLPLVVAPIKDDQPVIAGQVVRAGAGVRVKFGRVSASELRTAVRRVLDEPSFRQAAERARASFAAAGGASRAATLLEGLL